MIFLTALISFVGALASFSINEQLKGYFAMYCLLVTGMYGVFVALDLFVFYVFWEVMLLPMYFLIGIWGGPRAHTRRSSSSSTPSPAASSCCSPSSGST